MSEEIDQQSSSQTENYDTPDIVGDIDTVEEEISYLEKKKKIPVWIWIALIIIISIVTLIITSNQSPTLTM
jgi:hypothetical protein